MSDPRLSSKEWRLSHLYKIRNKQKELVPFTRNRAQRDYEAKRWSRNIILKSRQLGFTTDEAIDSLDDVLFTRNFDALLIGHNLDAAKKIFNDKISFAWNGMHPELQKLYRVNSDTAQTLRFDFGDKTFSSITVDTSGRSGTFQRVHVTEFAEICKKYPEKAKEIIEGTFPAVPTGGRIDIESTAQGSEGQFHDMFWDAWNRGEPTRNVEFKAHFYNWTWDDEELSTIVPEEVPKDFSDYQVIHNLSDVQITYYFHKWLSLNKDWNALRREYPTTPEEAFEASLEWSYYSLEMALAEREGRIKNVLYDHNLKVHTSWDLGVGPNLVVICWQRIPTELRIIDVLFGTKNEGIADLCKELQRRKYLYGKHFFPPDGWAHEEGSGKRRIEYADEMGFTPTMVPDLSPDDRIDALRRVFPKLYISNHTPELQRLITALKQYQREWDSKLGKPKDNPLKNWASHFADSAQHGAVMEEEMTNAPKVSVTSHQPAFKGYNRT
jgi:hypothetical protein